MREIQSSGVTNAFDINSIDVEDTTVNLTVKKIATPTTTRTPYTPLLVIVRLSREFRNYIEGLRAKIVSLCDGSLYQIFDNMFSFQAHIEHLK